MATTSFAESFKYGARLFVLFLAVVIVGGGGLGLGAALIESEMVGWDLPSDPDVAIFAGGAVLGVLGTSVLVIGHFAIVHKLIADGVARGSTEMSVDIEAAGSGTEQAPEPGDDEQTPDQQSLTAEPVEREPTRTEADAESRQPPTEPDQQPSPAAGEQPPMESSAAEPTEPARPVEAEENDDAGREQTAEEIVFGSSEPEDGAGGDGIDEGPEQSREDAETAGSADTDPLADNFDEE
ncbi:hypothetical protein GRX03_12150 [Halovenus sp. WSH3]|uniref:Uncharacterized protein n=1 Tax=Halovenus carboxidivorans TaxID=2692199 RepID=A0A6B0TAF3_9EURY|nr:hypothetical protein [Halovenus carboxidivorans]MXR52352.1 hypothetical protein [Halovenus carboxidivorans]